MSARRLLVLLAVGLVACLPVDVAAHAILLRTDPSSTRTLDASPPQVRLLFSEPIDASFSRARVFDAAGAQVDLGDSRVDQNELVVSLPPDLPDGEYSVVWRSLSTIDVHPEVGDFSLFVNVPVVNRPTASTGLAQQGESTPAATFARWWLYVAVSGFAGVLAAWKLVYAPTLPTDSSIRGQALLRAQRLALLAGALLLVGTLFAAVAQAAQAAGMPLHEAIGAPLRDLLTRGRFASIWWPRMAISLIAVAIVAFRGLDDNWSESAAAMVPAILLTNSLTSHGATLPMALLGVAVDWLHVLGAAVWIGGLAALAWLSGLLRGHETLLNQSTRRFTRVALVAVGVLLVSGTVQTLLEVGSWAALAGTPYGVGVLCKIGLLAVMLVLGFFNQRQPGADRFVRRVRIELALGIVALAIAAVISGTTPARQTFEPEYGSAVSVAPR